MKKQLLKNLLTCLSGLTPLRLQRRRSKPAFIVITMMFSCFTEFSSAQKANATFFCRCAYRSYGCKTTKCVAYCGPRCHLIAPVPVDARFLKNSYPNQVSQSNFAPLIITQSEDISTDFFESDRHFMKLVADSKMENLYKIEWGVFNKNGNW